MVSEQLRRVSEWLMVKASGDAPVTAAEAMHMSQVLAEIAGIAEANEARFADVENRLRERDRQIVPPHLRGSFDARDHDNVISLQERVSRRIGHRPPGDAA